MKLIASQSAEKNLLNALGRWEQVQELGHILNTLELALDLAADAKAMRELVDICQRCTVSGYRRAAAKILDRLESPLGVLHLTYGAVSQHPILNVDQTQFETATNARAALLRATQPLNEECIDILLSDLKSESGNIHIDALSATRNPVVENRLLEMLDSDRRAKVHAASALAMRGNDAGIEILKSNLSTDLFEICLIGLSHFQSKDIAAVVTAVSRDIKNRIGLSNNVFSKIYAQRLRLMREPAEKIFQEEYSRNISTIFPTLKTLEEKEAWAELPTDQKAYFFDADSTGWLYAPDFIFEFLGEESRHKISEDQTALANRISVLSEPHLAIILRGLSDPWRRISFGYTNKIVLSQGSEWLWPGFDVKYDSLDMAESIVGWLSHPNKYRSGAYSGRLLVAY